MKEQTFTIFHTPIFSFFSKPFYRQVATSWEGTGLGYLLLLLVVCVVPQAFKLQTSVNGFIDEFQPVLIKQLPVIEINDGIVSSDVKQPHYIKDASGKEIIVAIDTTGVLTSLEDIDAHALLTKTKLLIRNSATETRAHSLSQIDSLQITPEGVSRWLDIARHWTSWLWLGFAIIAGFISRSVQVLVYALVGMIFAQSSRVKLDFQALLRLAVAAVTPAIIIHALLSLAGVRLPLSGPVYFIIAMAYLAFGVNSYEPPTVETQPSHEVPK